MKGATETTPRESAYIAALSTLYENFKPDDSWKYFKKYSEALGRIAADYPSDVEAKVFQALALILAEPPGDVDLVEMKHAVQVLTPLLSEHPDHPGIAHYLSTRTRVRVDRLPRTAAHRTRGHPLNPKRESAQFDS